MYLEWPNRIWTASFDLKIFLDFLKLFCGDAPCNKLRLLRRLINFIIFGPTDQKLWVFEIFRRSLGWVGKCWSHPTRVDHMCKNMWVGGRSQILKFNYSK
jgi:hypothetical protein